MYNINNFIDLIYWNSNKINLYHPKEIIETLKSPIWHSIEDIRRGSNHQSRYHGKRRKHIGTNESLL